MYLINGQLHADFLLDTALDNLHKALPRLLAKPLDTPIVVDSAARFAHRLQSRELDLELDDEQRLALIDFCQSDNLHSKIERELGVQPHSLRRIDYRQARFESWHPLGLVVHITPGNAPMLAFCAVLESLLAGNINWLRPSSSDTGLTARLLAALGQCDDSNRLKEYIAVLPVPTSHVARLCTRADAVAAWGGETALKAIRQQLPAGCRWIDWGHRISFAYLCPDAAQPCALDALVDEVCRLDQQACSSPQWVLVNSDDPAVLRDLGARLAQAFSRRAAHWPALIPTLQEASEITTHRAIAQLHQCFSGHIGEVWTGAGWRVIWEHHRTLAPAPLFRTLILKPVPQQLMAETLLPWRTVLQSCALICAQDQTPTLVRALINAGVTRITPVSAIHEGYAGEPHDGVYALTRLSRRISVSLPPDVLSAQATLDALPPVPDTTHLAIMDKAAFHAQPIEKTTQLYFRSGGSSGTPALSGFSYRDFQRQMRAAADGLFAAGLDPSRDRVMNLFHGGNLYGGFFSFSWILQLLDAPHLPMGAPTDDDFSEIARLIVEQQVCVLIGMPSTLHRLFLKEQTTLRAYAGIRKVFLGGEHLGLASRQLMESCGVSTIRSAMYGSVDAGPLGHACAATPDGVFHLMCDTQHLEIVELEQDVPVQGTDVGRLLFTSRARQNQSVLRYEVGDTGRWVSGPCPCGLSTPRFELLARHGQWLRIGTEFISPTQLMHCSGVHIQIVLDHAPDGVERMSVRAEANAQLILDRLLADTTVAAAVSAELLILEVIPCPVSQFERNKHSGKVPLVIERRTQK
ncbi:MULTISPECIES: acyl-CoA reductase [unclassified Pseudomonas]|uniref:acyl-CoA reductase n=1 Tax=unclassified Pseudomonas TaxID=196821 RepID=UPI002AC97D79|nr:MULTISPECIES: acyl-CoA reductase [unclassified Pseudomonas]MEB0046791.1 acyl-CoA reductase [Pseudomonas sp. Dout3]MEB0097601.1 acyl-CoA reductase [Pseudomonas sp. DC1.2]WPX61250.1 acyl-CoA reductase [Pseudomonas sp. DC1.2]